ncbi:hypothetical protein MNR02_20280 (plasmid) [Shinella sp. H4-D48]|nr:hypothetical protein [Shinella sp. H4-D48]UNK40084.1 hypothetical protein MNR02_20280 [Shinella sp. H4-D48]
MMQRYLPFPLRIHDDKRRAYSVVHDRTVQMAINDVAEPLRDQRTHAKGTDILINERKCDAPERVPVTIEILLDLRAADIEPWQQAEKNGVARIDPGERLAIPGRCRSVPPLLYLIENYVMHLKTGALGRKPCGGHRGLCLGRIQMSGLRLAPVRHGDVSRQRISADGIKLSKISHNIPRALS